jgi:U4/U6 small nuclear ribonucleoprotein PRP31
VADGTVESADDDDDDVRNVTALDPSKEDLTSGSMLRFSSVTDVSSFFRGDVLRDVFDKLQQYGGDLTKNAITKDDDEYQFVNDCSKQVLTIDVEKTKVLRFIRDHYAVRFPELATMCSDSVGYAHCVRAIGNDVEHMAPHVELLIEHLPSQIVAAVIAASATTAGRELTDSELSAVKEACEEMIGLEDARNTINDYIQSRMPLVCPNLCAFMGTAITSQIFAIAGSVNALSLLTAEELAVLGSQSGSETGVRMKTAGFLVNVDMVQCQPPELRMKALRLVSTRASQLAAIDDNRRASDNSEGLKARKEIIYKMLEWTDPIVQQVQSRLKGLANKTYERRTRRRAADKAEKDRINRLAAKGMRQW